MVNTTAADDLAMQGDRKSEAMIDPVFPEHFQLEG